jgi:predicted dehydrogenase
MKTPSAIGRQLQDKPGKNIPRREFIKNSVVSLAALTIVPRHVLGGNGFVAPSDKINIGLVGAGGRSIGIISDLFTLDDVQIITVADPSEFCKDDFFYKREIGRGPIINLIEDHYSGKTTNYKVSEYEDFRVMLEKEKSLDAIVCASPDNTHAYISIYAMRAGKHVYCEKPLAHNIWEAREVRKVARETGVATQMINQLHSRDGLRQTVEYLRAGVIGKVKEAHIWVGATRWLPELSGFPEGTSPVPKGLNWDLWLGPTSWRPFHEVYTPVRWRDFWVFGSGAMGDFGCHDMDVATWAFNLRDPESVQVFPAGNRGSSEIAPYGEIGYYQFAGKGEQLPLKLTWYSGGLRPPLPDTLTSGTTLATNRGAMFIGDKGIILNNGTPGSDLQIFPESLRDSFTPPPPSIPRSKGHSREWIDAIKGGPAALSNFEYAARLTEITLHGVLSLRLGGEKIYWDSTNMKAIGLPEADKIIREPVRKGWEI